MSDQPLLSYEANQKIFSVAKDFLNGLLADENLIPLTAAVIRRFYDELVKAGFTDKQAIEIVKEYRIVNSGSSD